MKRSGFFPVLVMSLLMFPCLAFSQWERIDPGYPLGEYFSPVPMIYDDQCSTVVTLIEGTLWEWKDDWWIPIPSENEPPVVMYSRLVYDSIRSVYILWADNQIYEYKEGKWNHKETASAPPERYSPIFVYDSTREVTHLFGGLSADSIELVSDHWTWDGVDWNYEETYTTGPLTTQYFRGNEAAFDENRGVLVLVSLSGIWEWDGSSWRSFEGGKYAFAISSGTRDYYSSDGVVVPVYDSKDKIIRIMPSGAAWDGKKMESCPVPNLPVILNDASYGGNCFFSGCYDKKRDRILYQGSGYWSNMWEWDKFVWRLKAPVQTTFSNDGIMIYDQFRDEILLFNQEGELFCWKNDRWEPHYCTQKPARCEVAIAAPDANTSEILFLTNERSYYPGPTETWRWNGNDWHQDFPSSSPLWVFCGSLLFDYARNKPLYFSHYVVDDYPDYSYEFQQWVWTGGNWEREYPDNTPDPDFFYKGFALSDPLEKKIHLFTFSFSIEGDWYQHWIWNGSAWARIPDEVKKWTGEIFPEYGTIYFKTPDNSIHLTATDLWDIHKIHTWKWNGLEFQSVDSFQLGNIPQIRNGILYDPQNDRLLINGDYCDYMVTFEKTSDSLKLLSPDFRIPMCSLEGIFQDPTTDSLILQGGRPWVGPIAGCAVSPPVTWERKLSQWFWRWDVNQLTSGEGIVISYDDYRSQALSFGGVICNDDLHVPSNSTWIWDGNDWEQFDGDDLPLPRYNSALAYDNHRRKIVLFGGKSLLTDDYPFSDFFLNDTWIWDGVSWDEDHPTSFPCPRWGHVMAYDEAHQKVVLFGGEDDEGHILKDTWIYDGENWRQVFPAHTPDVFPSGMFYNKARRRITLFGDHSDRFYEWDGTDWRLYDVPNTPTLSFGSRFFYDKKGNCLWLYGAKGKPWMPGSYNSLWKLGFGPESGLTLERLISHLLGDAPFKIEELPFADPNKDGLVDMADLIFLLTEPAKRWNE